MNGMIFKRNRKPTSKRRKDEHIRIMMKVIEAQNDLVGDNNYFTRKLVEKLFKTHKECRDEMIKLTNHYQLKNHAKAVREYEQDFDRALRLELQRQMHMISEREYEIIRHNVCSHSSHCFVDLNYFISTFHK